MDEIDGIQVMQHTQYKKKKRLLLKPKYKYGVQVPMLVNEAMTLDKVRGNNFWEEALKAEVGSLVMVKCFEFTPRNHRIPRDFQFTTLHMVWDVNQDLRRKARLVAGGNL